MNKIAIPVVNGQLNSHFGHTNQFYIYEVENNVIVEEVAATPPPHEPGVHPRWLADMGVTDVLSGRMGQRAKSLFHENNINVFIGVAVKESKEIVIDFLNGNLETANNACDH